MVVKKGFIVFWWWSSNEFLLYFERPLEKLETETVPQNILENPVRAYEVTVAYQPSLAVRSLMNGAEDNGRPFVRP